MTLYDDLGVPADAPADAIKRAYKRAAAKTHPDKGGSTETFQVVNRAYAVLSDETKRARYDSTGLDGDLPDIRVAAQSQLSIMFCQLLDTHPVESTDFIAKLREVCTAGLAQAKQQAKAQKAKLKKLAAAKKRLSKKAGINFLTSALDQQTKQQSAILEGMVQNELLGDEMLKLLADYEYAADKVEPPTAGLLAAAFTFTTR